jgi:DNA polymerase I-like protein with 3'-5' exonuclease and polymerase domains
MPYRCKCCNKVCDTLAEDNVLITCDMSGAELRIIAELAQDPVWIGAFNRGEDVHSVGTEILHEAGWTNVALENCAYFKKHIEETIAKNALCTLGDAQRQKCDCPLHKSLRNENKSTNFLLAYGGGPGKLAKEIKKTLEKAKALMLLHSQKFPKIWAYLEKSGKDAQRLKKSFDMFGRRRIFPEPTHARARAKFISDNEKELRIPEEESAPKITLFTQYNNRKPNYDELYSLTHREPTRNEINKQMGGMKGGIERQGKNHSIQGTNATIAKLAAGVGHDHDGKPYLSLILPQYRAKFVKFVHDEIVVQCPKRFADKVASEIQDAFKRAAATKMKSVAMESEFNIGSFWSK